jgi:hypothetical protein
VPDTDDDGLAEFITVTVGKVARFAGVRQVTRPEAVWSMLGRYAPGRPLPEDVPLGEVPDVVLTAALASFMLSLDDPDAVLAALEGVRRRRATANGQ